MKVKLHGGPNQTPSENDGDDLWIAEKFQSNPDIAGSPRNSFRASLESESSGGRALNRRGGHKLTKTYQTSNTIETDSGVRLRVIRSVVKRETAQIDS